MAVVTGILSGIMHHFPFRQVGMAILAGGAFLLL